MRRFLKILHELGTVGLMGSLLTILVLSMTALAHPNEQYLGLRAGIELIGRYVLLPSLMLVLASGLFSIAATPAFHNAGWAWMKAATTALVLEGTFGAESRGREISRVAAQVAAGDGDSAMLAALVRSERGALWMLLLISAANIVVGVWRPKLQKRKVDERAKARVKADAARARTEAEEEESPAARAAELPEPDAARASAEPAS